MHILKEVHSGFKFFFRNMRFLRDSELNKVPISKKQCPMMWPRMTLFCVQGKDRIYIKQEENRH